MKVLVTGATSGLGRNAVEFLCQKGISVRATGRNEAMGKLLEKMGAEFVPADLTELVSSQAKVMLAGIDTLWHCSSFTSPWGTQQAFDLANVRATRRLGEWAVAWGVRNFIHISSPSLYFDYHHHRDIKEDFRPHRFANEFARSKAASEEVINMLSQANPQTRFTILRPQSLFGPHDKVFIPRLAHMMHHYGSILLPHGGSALVDMTYYENAVHAMWLASQEACDKLPSGRVYNITNIPSSEIGSGYFQETHPQELFRECSHYCELVSSPEQIPQVLAIAMRKAVLNRGVSVVVLPGDVALKPAPEGATTHWYHAPQPVVTPEEEELRKLAQLLRYSSNIALMCGSGCAGAHKELVEFAGKIKAPIVHALRGKEHVEYDNPYDVGMTGLIGFSSGFHTMMNADTLVLLGTQFPYRAFYPTDAKIIQIDINPASIGAHSKVDMALVGDIKSTLRALLPLVEEKTERNFLDKALEDYRDARKGLDDLAKPSEKAIHPQYLAQQISHFAADDAIFTCDVGTPTVWAARYLKMNGKRRLLGSFNHGSMANAMPQALGAQATEPERQVVAMCGDGGFSMLMGDFLSVVQMKLPVKIIVFNNSVLGFVAMEMKAGGYLTDGTELHDTNFARIAEACGITGIRVEKASEIDEALQRAFSIDGPVLVDVVVAKEELAIPPQIKLEQAKGFSLYMLRAIISGRGDEVIELAKTNWLR